MTFEKYSLIVWCVFHSLIATADQHPNKDTTKAPLKTQYPGVGVEVERFVASRGNESINLENCVKRLRYAVSGCDISGARGVIEFFATTDPCSIDPGFHDVLKEIKTLVEYNQTAPNTCGILENEALCSGELREFRESERCRAKIRSEAAYVRNYNSGMVATERSGNISFPQEFPPIPAGDELQIGLLDLGEGNAVYRTISEIVGRLQPEEFPFELVGRVAGGEIASHLVWFKVLKLEGILIAWIIVWAILCLCLPLSILASLCCPSNIRRLRDDSSDDSMKIAKCVKFIGAGFLQLLMLLLLSTVVLMLMSNEQVSKVLSASPKLLKTAQEDVSLFVRNTHMQMTFVVKKSTEITMQKLQKEMDEIDIFLGAPFQSELSSSTGIDSAFKSLIDVKDAVLKMSNRTSDLLNDCLSARTSGRALQEELEVLSQQLTFTRSMCSSRDRNLCDVLQPVGFEVEFSIYDMLMGDVKLTNLGSILREKGLNGSIDEAVRSFAEIPKRIAANTISQRADLWSVLNYHQNRIYDSLDNLDNFAAELEDSLDEKSVASAASVVPSIELWRWLSILGLSIALLSTWIFMVYGTPCNVRSTSKTTFCLTFGLTFLSILSILLWLVGSIHILFGSNAKSFICNQLENSSHLLKELSNDLIPKNTSLGLHPDFLRSCSRNETVYWTFHLNNTLDIESVTNWTTWSDLGSLLSQFSIATQSDFISDPTLTVQLNNLSQMLGLNLSEYRYRILRPVTKRDLVSFAEDLKVVSRRVGDRATVRRIENLIFRTKRILLNEVKTLEVLRDQILFKLTAIEVLLEPLRVQLERTIEHIQEVQKFINSHLEEMRQKHLNNYIGLLNDTLDNFSQYNKKQFSSEIGKCDSLYQIFTFIKTSFCSLVIDPINTISFCCFFIIFLSLMAAPFAVEIIQTYKELNEELSSATHRHTRDVALIDEQGLWATPSESSQDLIGETGDAVDDPPYVSRDDQVNSEQVWTTQRTPAINVVDSCTSPIQETSWNIFARKAKLIPQPPRPPPMENLRIFSPLSFQTPDVLSRASTPRLAATTASRKSRARTPRGRFQALGLVQPITWAKNFSSRNWL